ncbi:MAG TPA: hypothetical protein VN914_09175, partial [Polyangia bacterium]|nr:hypothetical protein [Polyangia bacterium]
MLVLVLDPSRHEHPLALEGAAASAPASAAPSTPASSSAGIAEHSSPFTAPLIASIPHVATQTPGNSPQALI